MTNQILPRFVRRVRFAGKYKQHRTIGVGDNFFQPIGVFQQQGRTLVTRETPRKADGEYIGVERIGEAKQTIKMGITAVDAQLLTTNALVHGFQHARLERLAYAPKNVIGNFIDALPESGVIAVTPFLAKIAIKHLGPFPGQERRHVNAVGDVGKWIFLCIYGGPKGRANFCRHVAMNFGDAILETRATNRQGRHVEIGGTVNDAKAVELIGRHGDITAQLL